jgi:starch synthase
MQEGMKEHPQIALVRGPSLNPWEMQSYMPLVSRCDLTLFANEVTPYWKDNSLPFPLERCFWWDQCVASWSPQAAWWLNGISSRLLGVSYHMRGLEEKLRGFEIIHALETYNTFSYQCALAKERYKSRLVLTVWETLPFRGEKHPLRRHRKREVMARTDAFLAVSERSREMLLKEGVRPEKIHVVSMGIDCQHFSPQAQNLSLRRQWGAGPDDFVILSVCRLVRSKGVHDLLEAFRLLNKRITARPLQLVYVGHGPEKETLIKKAAAWGLDARVHVVGGVPYQDMPSAYVSADCMALASQPTATWEEQFGYALVEAMACGKPVVSTRSGAIPEVVGEAGLLAIPFSPEHLAENLATLMDSPDLARAMGIKAREWALGRYQAQGVADRLYRLYQEVLA